VDVIDVHRRTGELFREIVRGVPAGAWDRPTPCTEWNARELVNHVVGEDRWTAPLMAGRTIADVGDALSGDLLGDDPAAAAEAAWAEAADVVPPAVRGAATVHLSYGEESAAEYATQLAADHLIHGWDLAVATGRPAELPADLVAAVAGWFAGREELYRGAGMVGARPALPEDATAQDRLLAGFGRDPRWAPPG
jgi:uncharacterized protein (TIGR03086 family)